MKTKNKKKFEIKNCPSCNSTSLLKFDGDLFCKECSWDSIVMSVACGEFDSIFSWACADAKNQDETKETIAPNIKQQISA